MTTPSGGSVLRGEEGEGTRRPPGVGSEIALAKQSGGSGGGGVLEGALSASVRLIRSELVPSNSSSSSQQITNFIGNTKNLVMIIKTYLPLTQKHWLPKT